MADDKEKNKAEILLLSVAANVVSRHTSMVGVDKDRKERVVGSMIQRDVPLMTSRMFACAAPPTKLRLSMCPASSRYNEMMVCVRFLMKLALFYCVQRAWCTFTWGSDGGFGDLMDV